MARYVGIMYRIRSHVPLQVRVQIFHSFVQSHFDFCALVWGFAAKSHIDSLFTQQKKGMRAIMPGHVNFLITIINLYCSFIKSTNLLNKKPKIKNRPKLVRTWWFEIYYLIYRLNRSALKFLCNSLNLRAFTSRIKPSKIVFTLHNRNLWE